MGNKHKTTDLDRARDELFSHIHRCEVLDATVEQQDDWFDETMGFMSERYPQLSKMEVAKLEMLGRRFCKPAIPHGKEDSAINRPEAAETVEDEREDEQEPESLQPV